MKELRKLLFISPVWPDPAGSGREKRAALWLRSLGEEYDVHLLVLQSSCSAGMQVKSDRERLIQVHFSALSKFLYLFSFLFSLIAGRRLAGTPLCFWLPLGRPQKKQLLDAYPDVVFDKVLCFRLYLSEYAGFFSSLPGRPTTELDMDDLESDTWDKIAALHRKKRDWKKWLFCRLTAFQFRRNEGRACALFPVIYICSQDDQHLLQRRYEHPDVRVFVNKVFGRARSPRISAPTSNLVFTGSLGYYPNEEAVVWFIRHVLPKLRSSSKEICLHIAGFSAPARLEALFASTPGLVFYRDLDDIEKLYARGAVAISPLHAGGGTKLKVIEAMWFGLPVVASSESARGLGLRHGEHYLLADSPEDFIAACTALLQDESLYRRISANGNRWIGEHYSFVEKRPEPVL
ncbi:glycosyltransferase [Arcticibacter sp. MXS-1]|uniref:glycosyltransferase n=1 Tax=Arcticibacter sp. MXS-1 TaxID=3341726 RepID=UPI0035A92971